MPLSPLRPAPAAITEFVLLKRFAPLVKVSAVPPFPPLALGTRYPLMELVATPFPTWSVPLLTTMVEAALALVMLPAAVTLVQNCREPLFVIVPVIKVVGLVITSVTPEAIVPPVV
jgi:hypothetical protein